MAVDIVLNDLSLLTITDQGTARKLMSDVMAVLIIANGLGVKSSRTKDEPYTVNLAPGYPIAKWINTLGKEERLLFQSMISKKPLLKTISGSPSIQRLSNLMRFGHQGQVAEILGMAYSLNALVVSLASEPKWICDSLDLEITALEDDLSPEGETASGTAEPVSRRSIEKLIHASQSHHIIGHKAEIQTRFLAEPWHPEDELLPCYIKADGSSPIVEWLETLSDKQAQELIQAKLSQVKNGVPGDWKSVGEGVQELRIFYGPGYRIYFSQGTTHGLLLCGGDKSSQSQDIKQAQQYWKDYKKQQRTLN